MPDFLSCQVSENPRKNSVVQHYGKSNSLTPFSPPSKNKKKKSKRFGNNIILQYKLWIMVQKENKKEGRKMLLKFVSCHFSLAIKFNGKQSPL